VLQMDDVTISVGEMNTALHAAAIEPAALKACRRHTCVRVQALGRVCRRRAPRRRACVGGLG
jgi:hypothetical protein